RGGERRGGGEVPAGWSWPLEGGDRLLGCLQDGEQRIQLGELEQRLEIFVEPRQSQIPALLADLLRERDQDAEAGGVDVAGAAEVDDELLGAALERVQHLLLELLPVADDQLPVDAHDDDPLGIFPQVDAHAVSSACRMATVAVSTISSGVAPRDRSATGRARPCRIGPMAPQSPSRWTSLYAMFPASKSGKTSTVARPAAGEPGLLVLATSGTRAASLCSSPSHGTSGASRRNSSTARRTRSTRGPSALPLVLYDRNATTGWSPTMRRRSREAASAMSASCSGVGSGTTEQSVKVSTRSPSTI